MSATYNEIFQKQIPFETAQPCLVQVSTGARAKPSSELVTWEKVLSNGDKKSRSNQCCKVLTGRINIKEIKQTRRQKQSDL